MDRGAWQVMVHGVARVGHDLATKERERENIEQSFLCSTVGLCWLSILNIAVCTCQLHFLNTGVSQLFTFWDFPSGSRGKESVCNVGDLGLIPGSARSLEEGTDYPLKYSCLENSMHKGAW